MSYRSAKCTRLNDGRFQLRLIARDSLGNVVRKQYLFPTSRQDAEHMAARWNRTGTLECRWS